MLEHMGLKVMSEIPYDVYPEGAAGPVWMHDFAMRTEDGAAVDLGQVKDAFHETFARVWRAEMEDDGFNKLVLHAGLRAREVQILRAYCKFLRQAGIAFQQPYMEQTLARNPRIARRLIDLPGTAQGPRRRNGRKDSSARSSRRSKRSPTWTRTGSSGAF
jgi:glutamate dehydrogenase